MSKSSHESTSGQNEQNQNNAMSDDPGDGSRVSFTTGKDGSARVEKQPEHDVQDQSTIEAFGEAGDGVAAKESPCPTRTSLKSIPTTICRATKASSSPSPTGPRAIPDRGG